MRPVTAIALFCEDIREEKAGPDTLVGILPDNISLNSGPGVIPKLAVYLRIQVDDDVDVSPIAVRVIFPGGREIPMATFEVSVIEEARKQSQSHGIPFTGLIGKVIMSPVPVDASGKIEAIMTINNEDFICGVLNIIVTGGSSNET